MFFYSDKELIYNTKNVLLCGGFSGHGNFGDILQLRGVVNYYKSINRDPIVIISIESIYDKDFLSTLYQWFPVSSFLYYSHVDFDCSDINLKPIENIQFDLYHLYGGGMINRFWAKDIIALNENIINHFNIKNYILSGQQIDEVGASLLQEHFKLFTPSLVGVRDQDSLNFLKKYQIECDYSFDDAFEEIQLIKQQISIKDSPEKTIYLHLNLSPYVSDNLHQIIQEYIEALKLLKDLYPQGEFKLLLTYLDSRILSIIDTLGAIGSLDYHFDFDSVEVINLAIMSLKNNFSNKVFFKNSITLCTSYHTAMFFQELGFDVYMLSGNDYYNQKLKGLSLKPFHLQDLYDTQKKQELPQREQIRSNWLKKLSTNLHIKKDLKRDTFSIKDFNFDKVFNKKLIQTNIHDVLTSINRPKNIEHKVFGIGWAKTGTTTLGEALKTLGFNHKSQDLSLLDKIINSDFFDLKRTLETFDSFDDWPWIKIYKELDFFCPNSKFILTIRESQNWLRSYKNMLDKEREPSKLTIKRRNFLYGIDTTCADDKSLIEIYERHNKEVISYFQNRTQDLLVVNWEEDPSWEALCNFLTKETPNTSFPHKNKGIYH